ncbi:hypothetical protein ES703_28160 [subsurface metagenome]
MKAGNDQQECTPGMPSPHHLEGDPAVQLRFDIADHIIRVGRQAISLHLTKTSSTLAQNSHQLWAVGAGDNVPLIGHTLEKDAKGRTHVLDARIAIRMVHLHVGHHSHVWPQAVECSVVFVGFDHKVPRMGHKVPRTGHKAWAAAGLRVGAQLDNDATHDEGRRIAQALQNHREHGGRRGLAVSASHSDPIAASHHWAQQLLALHHGNPRRPCRLHLHILLGNGRRYDHQFRPSHLLGQVPHMGLDAQAVQIASNSRGPQVRARYDVPPARQDAGNRRQPDAPNAHHVDASG